MITKEKFDDIKIKFNNFFELKEKRPGIYQLFVPLYHADGDMMDIFVKESENNPSMFTITDVGLTLMRLSYTYDIDTPNKDKILNKILSEYNIKNENENLSIETSIDSFYPTLMQFAQTVSKITNMRLFKREVIQSLFFEMLDEFIMTNLTKYNPQKKFYPIKDHEEYEVDYCFNSRKKPIYLFGVNSSANARLATISCQKFISEKLPFQSLIVYESLDTIGKKDQARLMSAADKQFPALDDFKVNSLEFFERN